MIVDVGKDLWIDWKDAGIKTRNKHKSQNNTPES